MAPVIQNDGRGSVIAVQPEDEERGDPFEIVLQYAHDTFDPKRAELEQHADTPPLIWYIEDEPDVVLLMLRADEPFGPHRS